MESSNRFRVEYYEIGLKKSYISLRKARFEALKSGFKFRIYECIGSRLKLLEYK